MSRLRTAILFIVLGLLINATIAACLSATVNFNRTPAVAPSRDIQTSVYSSNLGGLYIDWVHGLGTQRRAWRYENLLSSYSHPPLGYPDLLSQLSNNQRSIQGPLISLALGGPDSWGLLYSVNPNNEDELRSFHGSESAAGFPALSFWHEIRVKNARNHKAPGAIQLKPKQSNSMRDIRAIPYRPIWPGLIFNTIFYALLAFITHRLVRTIREHRRFTKGNCPKCKYDLNANFAPGCPECGWRRSIPRPLGPAQ